MNMQNTPQTKPAKGLSSTPVANRPPPRKNPSAQATTTAPQAKAPQTRRPDLSQVARTSIVPPQDDKETLRSRTTNERLDVRPVLIVGIGGTGSLAVKHVKKRALEIAGNKPIPFMKFLVFDTTVEDSSVTKLDEGEFINIGQLDFNEIVQHIREYKHLVDWFPYDRFKPMQLGLGAMGVRHIGRLCYFQWRESSRVRDLVMNRIQELMNPTLPDKVRECGHVGDVRLDQSTGIDIHVVGSGAGGTGSGIVLDVAYDLRQWAKNIAKSARVIGHILLPDAFEGLVPEPVMPQIENNSYALLSEMDHFIGHGGWDVNYKSEKVKTSETPFDLVYLLGRNSIDGAARTRSELVAITGNVIANLGLTAAGKDLMDTAVNLIPPILSGTDERHRKPCPYGSYGLSIATTDRREIAADGSLRVQQNILDAILGRGDDSHGRMRSRAESFLNDIPLSTDELEKFCPEPPQFNPVGEPVNVSDAEIFRENQHVPRLQEAARSQRQGWETTLENRFGQASGSRFLSELKHMLTSKEEARIGELADFTDGLTEELQKLGQWCDNRQEELERETGGASSRIQELRVRRSLPEDWLKTYSELVRKQDQHDIQTQYYRHVRELCLKVARELQQTTRRTLEAYSEVLAKLRDRIEDKFRDEDDFDVPYCKFASSREVLAGLYEDISGTTLRYRQLLADLFDEGPRKTHDRVDALSSALEHIANQAVEGTLADYSIGNQLDLHKISQELERRKPELLRMKLKNMYNLSQPAFRCREQYPKEKIVTTGRLTSSSAGPAVRFLRTIDGSIQGVPEHPSNFALLRFVYGLPLWAIEGVEKWEQTAVHVQSTQQTLHNFLDPRWAEQIEPLIPKPTEYRENVWLFTMSFALGRIGKPVETYEIDGEKLRGVRDRGACAVEFEKRLKSGVISRDKLEDQVEDHLRRQGDHAAQLEVLEEHLSGLLAKLEKAQGAPDGREDVKILRDEIVVVKEHIARKRRDL